MRLELDPPPPDPPPAPRVGPPPAPPPPPEPHPHPHHGTTYPRSFLASAAFHALLFALFAWLVESTPRPTETSVAINLRLDPAPASSDPEAEPGGTDPRTEMPAEEPTEEIAQPDDWFSDGTGAPAEEDFPVEAPRRSDGTVGLAMGSTDARLARGTYEGRFGGRERLVREGGGDGSTEGALHRALAWLARHQFVDGTWSAGAFSKRCEGTPCTGPGDKDYVEAATALALLPFLGAGHTHTEGKWQTTVRRGVRALVERQLEDGSWGTDSRRAYASAFATLVLAEAYGMTGSTQLREPAQRAANYWVQHQSMDGGWRYVPGDGTADSSVTGWVAVALYAARRAGLEVPQRTLLGCRGWFQGRTAANGAVGYTGAGSGTAAMLGTGLFVETILGADPQSPRLRATAGLLASRLPKASKASMDYGREFGVSDPIHWFYGGLAAFQRGGDLWTVWELRLRDALLPTQERNGDLDGSWPPMGLTGEIGGRVITTSLCALALEVYYRYPRVTMTTR